MLQLVLVLRNAAASCLFIKDCCSCMSFYQGVLLVLFLLTRVVFFLVFYQDLLFLLVLSSRIVVPTVPFSKACCCNLSARFAIHMVELHFSYFFSYWVPPVPGSKGCFLKASWSFQQGLVSSCQHSSDLSCKASALLKLSSFNLS